MSERIMIDFDRVAQSVTVVEAASTAIREVLDRLDTELAAMEGGWQGEAFISYRAMRTHWESQMRSMQTKLSAYSKILEGAGSGFAENERTLAASF